MKIESICNDNAMNCPSDNVYESFNQFIFSDDLKLLGKLLLRFKFFLKTKNLPGDIVEVGVFKGSGMATFTKFIEIFCPNSNKKVIGFDIFNPEEGDFILTGKDTPIDRKTMTTVYSKVDKNDLALSAVEQKLLNISDKASDRIKLVEGDVELTIPEFLENNPGFRASLIYIDVDLERPTYHALCNLWDRLLPGGYILFDEYEYHVFSESNGVEKFLKDKNLSYNIKSTNWIAPTAYMLKKDF
jgi:hypothetical protein